MPLPWGETSQVSKHEVLNLTLSGSASILGTSTQPLNSDQQRKLHFQGLKCLQDGVVY